MFRSPHRSVDLSRAPDARQELTAGSADFAVAWTAGLLLALVTRWLFGAASAAPFLVLLAVATAVLVLNAVVLAGLTGQSVGARFAQTADVSSRTGRPAGVRVMAQALATGGASRDPRLVRISLAGG